MNVGAYRGGRPEYYDRAAIGISKAYESGAIAPHAATSRWTYTVPANKRAVLLATQLFLRRWTVAAPAGEVGVEVGYTPFGGGYNRIVKIRYFDNTAGDQRELVVSPQLQMQAGDNISCLTIDTSTGGSLVIAVLGTIVEYDS